VITNVSEQPDASFFKVEICFPFDYTMSKPRRSQSQPCENLKLHKLFVTLVSTLSQVISIINDAGLCSIACSIRKVGLPSFSSGVQDPFTLVVYIPVPAVIFCPHSAYVLWSVVLVYRTKAGSYLACASAEMTNNRMVRSHSSAVF
jgi:hypothetical protein